MRDAVAQPALPSTDECIGLRTAGVWLMVRHEKQDESDSSE
jgi:hypothetical protein